MLWLALYKFERGDAEHEDTKQNTETIDFVVQKYKYITGYT